MAVADASKVVTDRCGGLATQETLVELLEVLRADTPLAVVIACSSRDSLDAVVAALARSGGVNLAVLHSDMELHEQQQQVLQLKSHLQPAAQHDTEGLPLQQNHQHPQQHHHQQQQQQQPTAQQMPPLQPQHQPTQQQQLQQAQAPLLPAHVPVANDRRSAALVTTDVCLRLLPKELLPLGPPLLIQYDPPTSKEVLQRRLTCAFGSSKERNRKGGRLVTIDFVVAGQLAAFRARERMGGAVVQEMPVHVPDVFA